MNQLFISNQLKNLIEKIAARDKQRMQINHNKRYKNIV